MRQPTPESPAPRRVAYFTDSETFGGAEQSLLRLFGELDRRYWCPLLLCPPAPELAPLIAGARKLAVECRAVPRRQHAPPLSQPARFMALTRYLRARQPALFHANLSWPLACKFGIAAAQLAGVQTIVATVHSCDILTDHPSRLVQALLGRRIDAYIAVSAAVFERLVDRLAVPRRKIQVIYNGVPMTTFARASTIPGVGRGGRPPVILCVARLEDQKGHRFLLQALASLPQARLVLAGEGPERERLGLLAESLGVCDQVSFLGYRQDVTELLAGCDVVALPSLDEGFPLAVLEAMAASKPVVATAVGGIPEAIVHGKHGLLVPPGDAASLAAALGAILGDPVLAARLGAAARGRVEREFSATTMARHVMQLYADCLAEDSRARPASSNFEP